MFDEAQKNCLAMGGKLYEPYGNHTDTSVYGMLYDNNPRALNTFWIGIRRISDK